MRPPAILLQAAAIPNDPRYNLQWHYHENSGPIYGMNLPKAWDITSGNEIVVGGRDAPCMPPHAAAGFVVEVLEC